MMVVNGERPIVDFVKRSAECQNSLYKKGKTKLDGYVKKSAHQRGMAADIYLVNKKGNALTWDRELFKYYHEFWELIGGKPMIEWDIGHFEM